MQAKELEINCHLWIGSMDLMVVNRQFYLMFEFRMHIIDRARKIVFDQISKHLKNCPKYSAVRGIFKSFSVIRNSVFLCSQSPYGNLAYIDVTVEAVYIFALILTILASLNQLCRAFHLSGQYFFAFSMLLHRSCALVSDSLSGKALSLK